MSAIVRSEAIDLFYRSQLKAQFAEWFARLTRRCHRLLSVEELLGSRPGYQRMEAGYQLVPIDRIVASVGRAHDFTHSFLPRAGVNAQRWAGIYEALQSPEGLPEVELLQIGDVFAVVDGNHRISVAHAAGVKQIPAHVTRVITPAPPIA